MHSVPFQPSLPARSPAVRVVQVPLPVAELAVAMSLLRAVGLLFGSPAFVASSDPRLRRVSSHCGYLTSSRLCLPLRSPTRGPASPVHLLPYAAQAATDVQRESRGRGGEAGDKWAWT